MEDLEINISQKVSSKFRCAEVKVQLISEIEFENQKIQVIRFVECIDKVP